MNKYLEKAALLITLYQHDETGRKTWVKDNEPAPGEGWSKVGPQTYKKKGWSKKADNTQDLTLAKKSRGEEQKAIEDYTSRLKTINNPYLSKVMSHALGEEKEHHAGFVKAVEELSAKGR